MSLKLYYDLMSQPSRALYILLSKYYSNFEPKYVDLRKGEHFSDEFTKVNKIQKVPVIDHNGFVLTESVAIIRYLAKQGIIPESLYPADTVKQARVDEFLEWQHIGLRLHCSMYFRVKYMDPLLSNREPNQKQVDAFERRMVSALEVLDTKWLGNNPFVAGEQISVADLLAACELEQPKMASFDPTLKYKNVAAWAKRVRDHFNPHYDAANVIINKIISKNQRAASKL